MNVGERTGWGQAPGRSFLCCCIVRAKGIITIMTRLGGVKDV